MEETLSLEQQQALALARARRRRAESESNQPPQEPPKLERSIWQRTGDDIAGLVQGAGDIGATLMAPKDYIEDFSEQIITGKAPNESRNAVRRRETTNALSLMGADTDSNAFKANRFAGNIAGTAGIAPARGARFLANVAKGSTAGAASAGLVDPETAVAGGVIGGSIPLFGAPVAAGARWGMNKLHGVTDLFFPGGAERILDRYTKRIIGEKNLPIVVNAAKNSTEMIPNGKPTLAHATAWLPEGSPLAALEDITAKSPGGNSALFGARKLEQEGAIAAAETMRDAVTAPMRSGALAAAGKGGVKSAPVIKEVEALASREGYRASDVVTKTLGHIRTKLESLTDDATGVINPNDLYTIRKEIGSTIKQFSNETANWDKGLTAKLERSLQLSIDDAIEKAGGKGWKNYLDEYAKRSQAMEMYVARRELSKNPLQATNLSGGVNIAEETRTHLPNMLSRPMMLVNAATKAMGRNIETEIDAISALRHLNPQEFVKAMERVPVAQRNAFKQAWIAARNPLVTAGALATSDR